MNIPAGTNVVFVVTFFAVALALVLANVSKRSS